MKSAIIIAIAVVFLFAPMTVYGASYDGTYNYWFTMFNDPDFNDARKISSGFIVSNNNISSSQSGYFSGSVTSGGSVSFSGGCPPSSVATAKYTGTLYSNGSGEGTYVCYYNGVKQGGQGNWSVQKIGGSQPNIPSGGTTDSAYDWNEIGTDLMKQEKYEEALNAFDKAIQYDPNYKWAWANQGKALFEMYDYADALIPLNKAIQLDPNYTFAWYYKGNALWQLDRDDDAIDTYRKVIAIDPNYASAHFMLGKVLYYHDNYENKYEESLFHFKTATALEPDDFTYKNWLETAEKKISGEGCLIATATFGSELAPQVQMLREIRDNSLLETNSGAAFMGGFNAIYYSFAPTVAQWENENPVFKETVRIVITPLISSLSLLNYVDMDSEAEVLGYGISLILLNIGMYVGIPAAVIVGIRKRF